MCWIVSNVTFKPNSEGMVLVMFMVRLPTFLIRKGNVAEMEFGKVKVDENEP